MDNRIRAFREARGQSLEALAAEAGTTNQQISLFETGKRRLTVEWLLRLRELDSDALVVDKVPTPTQLVDHPPVAVTWQFVLDGLNKLDQLFCS